ncbi:MAG: rhomboid family intramembrane serine protease [Gammaproteobacteria bacterium]|nr:rhomboid family intramembrane serine protease [Gammaproteobacteria bacterium]
MNPMKQLERKLSRFAIHDLTMYLVGGQGLALLLSLAKPAFLGALVLVPAAVLAGQWWRLLTFLFTPPAVNPIFAAFALYLLWFMGGALEAQWGTVRYNLYVLIGYLMTAAGAFAFPYYPASNGYLIGSIFLAFAYLFPRYEIYLFFILPVQVKWLALLTWLFYGFAFLTGGWAARILILAATTNFLVFFGGDLLHQLRYGHRRLRQQARAAVERGKPLHLCTVCGITDKTHPTMDFRYCTKCEPPVAYCTEHLRNHEHRRTEPENEAQ